MLDGSILLLDDRKLSPGVIGRFEHLGWRRYLLDLLFFLAWRLPEFGLVVLLGETFLHDLPQALLDIHIEYVGFWLLGLTFLERGGLLELGVFVSSGLALPLRGRLPGDLVLVEDELLEVGVVLFVVGILLHDLRLIDRIHDRFEI